MNVYVDTSVIVRILLGQSDELAEWSSIVQPITSELTRIECMRTIDRTARRAQLTAETVADLRAAAFDLLSHFVLMPISSAIVDRAADPFPVTLGTLDAIHLATAILATQDYEPLVLATHDRELAGAARSMGFAVLGS